MKDPIGQAIHDYYTFGKADDIVIQTNYTEDEQLDPSYFFRTEDEMPPIEKTALLLSSGNVLDVGAGAGSHSLSLQKRGIHVTALEVSSLAVEVMKKRGVKNVVCSDLYQFHDHGFDTILLLMNGTGIARKLAGLKKMLLHLKMLLNDKGSILIDSSDIRYLFMEDDGSIWIDLTNDKYYGEMNYSLCYKNIYSEFNWLFVDFDTLQKVAASVGLKTHLVEKGLHHDFLARLTM